MHKERKIAQIAAYFLYKADGSMNGMKLNKLMYLADRESLRRTGYPITHDEMVSWSESPILNQTRQFIDGVVSSESGAWEEWISSKVNSNITLRNKIEDRDIENPRFFNHMSPYNKKIFNSVWDDYGHMSAEELIDHTHKYCPEWNKEDTHNPIRYSEVLMEVGYKEKDAEELESEILTHQYLADNFSLVRI